MSDPEEIVPKFKAGDYVSPRPACEEMFRATVYSQMAKKGCVPPRSDDHLAFLIHRIVEVEIAPDAEGNDVPVYALEGIPKTMFTESFLQLASRQ